MPINVFGEKPDVFLGELDHTNFTTPAAKKNDYFTLDDGRAYRATSQSVPAGSANVIDLNHWEVDEVHTYRKFKKVTLTSAELTAHNAAHRPESPLNSDVKAVADAKGALPSNIVLYETLRHTADRRDGAVYQWDVTENNVYVRRDVEVRYYHVDLDEADTAADQPDWVFVPADGQPIRQTRLGDGSHDTLYDGNADIAVERVVGLQGEFDKVTSWHETLELSTDVLDRAQAHAKPFATMVVKDRSATIPGKYDITFPIADQSDAFIVQLAPDEDGLSILGRFFHTYPFLGEGPILSDPFIDGGEPNIYTHIIGRTITETFYGTSVYFKSFTDNRGGMWEFTVDALPPVQISVYNDEDLYQTQLIASGLSLANHTVVGEFIGNDPSNAPVEGQARGWAYSFTSRDATAGPYLGSNIDNTKLFTLGSNIEFAINVGASNGAWVPYHSDLGGVEVTSFKTTELSADALTASGQTIDRFFVEQEYSAKYPNDQGVGVIWNGTLTHIFYDGRVEILHTLDFVQDTYINVAYLNMFPLDDVRLQSFETALDKIESFERVQARHAERLADEPVTAVTAKFHNDISITTTIDTPFTSIGNDPTKGQTFLFAYNDRGPKWYTNSVIDDEVIPSGTKWTSKQTLYMAVSTPTATVNTVAVPVNTVLPVITGAGYAGQTLTVTPGTWSSGTISTYQWLADGVEILGATDLTYVVDPQYDGVEFTCKETRSDITVTSNALHHWTPALATTALLLDSAHTETITETANAISLWADMSGNDRDFIGVGQPTLTSGAVVFDGVGDYLYRDSAFLYDAGSAEVFVVATIAAGQVGTRIISEGRSTSAVEIYDLARTAASDEMGGYLRNSANEVRFDSAVELSTGDAMDGTKKIYHWKDTGTVFSGRVDGGTEVTSAYTRGSATAVDQMAIGALMRTTVTSFVDSTMWKIVVKTGTLSDTTEREKIEGFLAHSTGVTLDAGHTYFATPPSVV